MKYWTKSWNTIYGCQKIREGCQNCWAESMARRMQAQGLFEATPILNAKGWTGAIENQPKKIDLPLSWQRPQVVAVNWMGDMFYYIPSNIADIFSVMRRTPHIYLILTKRYDNMLSVINKYTPIKLENVYLGVTISNPTDAKDAHYPLRQLHDHGWKTWVSFEPALKVVDWSGYEWLNGMVCGGESGPHARPMPLEAVRSARDFCSENEIGFTFKQGEKGADPVIDGKRYAQFPVEYFYR
jgi:protein gp37